MHPKLSEFRRGFRCTRRCRKSCGTRYEGSRESVQLVLKKNPVFVCVAALAILDRLDEIDKPTLCWWLAERQLPNGGLNGRPEKLEDVRGPNFSSNYIFSADCTCAGLLFVLGPLSALNSERHTLHLRSKTHYIHPLIAGSHQWRDSRSARRRCGRISYSFWGCWIVVIRTRRPRPNQSYVLYAEKFDG